IHTSTIYISLSITDTATTQIHTLSLHDALPISSPDVHPRRVHEPAPDHGVHARHQVVVVGAGIVVVDAVGEHVAVARAAARVRVQHHVAVRGEVLERVAEAHVVHRERAAVNLQDQRVLLVTIERRWLDDPALHTRPAARRVPDLLDLGQPRWRRIAARATPSA